MNPSSTINGSRHQKLAALLRQDPDNVLLIADAAEAALAEANFASVEEHIAAGVGLEGATKAWRFREASLRIAQRRLTDAVALLEALRDSSPADVSLDHNLAYVRFLEGRYADCTGLLQPWLDGTRTIELQALGPVAALWLRALHHEGELARAWAWVERHANNLPTPEVAGIASLIALDLDNEVAAEKLARSVLRVEPSQLEASIVAATIATARGEGTRAATLLGHAMERHPHQARAWSTLGFAELAGSNHAEAQRHFRKALDFAPADSGSWLGLGWSEVLGRNLEAAQLAFERALEAGADPADAHGAMAVVLALRGEERKGEEQVKLAIQLGGDGMTTKFAQAVLGGSRADMSNVQMLARQILKRAH